MGLLCGERVSRRGLYFREFRRVIASKCPVFAVSFSLFHRVGIPWRLGYLHVSCVGWLFNCYCQLCRMKLRWGNRRGDCWVGVLQYWGEIGETRLVFPGVKKDEG